MTIDKLNEDQIQQLVLAFCMLRREYEEIRKRSSLMESTLQYNSRLIEIDLARRGYTT